MCVCGGGCRLTRDIEWGLRGGEGWDGGTGKGGVCEGRLTRDIKWESGGGVVRGGGGGEGGLEGEGGGGVCEDHYARDIKWGIESRLGL